MMDLKRVFIFLLLFSSIISVSGATYTVTNTNDSGSGSLRQAITNANGNAGADNIYFNIAGAGVHTITLLSQLPTITGPTNLDATTQPGYSGSPLIELNGNNTAIDGLGITGGNSTIKGLIINNCTSNGLYISSNGNNTIQANYIGTDATGTFIFNNGANGISMVNISNNQVGGSTGLGNIISGNLGNGISILGSSCDNNTLEGNYIGTNSSGADLGNSLNGVRIIDGDNNTIGSTSVALQNTIAFNDGDGVLIYSSSGTPTNNSVLINSIYLNDNEGIDLGNDGVTLNDVNDADGGPNATQNWSTVTSVTYDGANTTITGLIHTLSNTAFRVDLYGTEIDEADVNYGEGKTFLATTNITTNFAGNASYNVVLTGVLLTFQEKVSAIVTRDLGGGNYGDSSEFGLSSEFDDPELCGNSIDDNGDGRVDESLPGGIGDNLLLWLKADKDFSAGSWLDQSPHANDATNFGDPSSVANSLNFNPGIYYDGNDHTTSPLAEMQFFNGTYHASVIAVYKPTTNSTAQGILGNQGGGGSNNINVINGSIGRGSGGLMPVPEFYGNTTHLVGYIVDEDDLVSGTANSSEIYQAGTLLYNFLFNENGLASDPNFHFGKSGSHPSSLFFDGTIYEVMIYFNDDGNVSIDNTQRESIETYLAIKYGQMLNHNFLDSQGNLIKDIDDEFGWGITCIGRDDAFILHQPKSISKNEFNDIIISSNDFQDRDFVVLSHDNKSEKKISQTSFLSQELRVSERIWSIENKGSSKSLNIEINSRNGSDVLILSEDENFSKYQVLSISDANRLQLNLSQRVYFKLGSFSHSIFAQN